MNFNLDLTDLSHFKVMKGVQAKVKVRSQESRCRHTVSNLGGLAERPNTRADETIIL